MKSVILFQPKMGFYDLVVRNIPLGLLSIVRSVKDVDVHIVDQRLPRWEYALREALKRNPLAVCFTVMTGRQIGFALDVSTRLKRECSALPILWGGIHPTLLSQQVISHAAVDIVVSGEADRIFPDILSTLEKGNLADAPSLWYKQQGVVRHTSPASIAVDLNDLAILPYGLIDFKQYAHCAEIGFGNVVPLEVGRGCPHKCIYCYNSTDVRKGWRALSAERIYDHIEHLKKYTSFDGINFIDDNFFTDKKRVETFTHLYAQRKETFVWGGEAGINELKKIDNALLENLVQCGLRWLSIGVESGSPKILDYIEKHITVNDVVTLNRRLKKYNISPMYNFMNGYINESKSELHETTSLMLTILKTNPKATVQTFNVIVPYPGTRYLENCRQRGLTVPATLEQWINYNPDDWLSYPSWIDKKHKRLLKLLYVASIFIDKKPYSSIGHINTWVFLVRCVQILYYPIAWLRFRFCTGFLPLENIFFALFKKMWVRSSP